MPNFNNENSLHLLKVAAGMSMLLFTGLFWYLELIMIFSFTLLTSGLLDLGLDFMVDCESMLFFFSISWISVSVFNYSLSYMSQDASRSRFISLLFSFVLSMWILVFSGNMMLLLIGWDGLGVSSFLLVIYFQNSNSANAGLITMLTNRVGDVFIMLSLIFFLGSGGTSTWLWGSGGCLLSQLGVFMIILAAFTKSAQLPFSSWLPAAMAAPTPVSSLVHSSTLVTAGIYMLLRFKGHLESSWPGSCNLMLATGSATMVMAGAAGLLEDDFKKMVALSTLSQLGLMVCCLGLSCYQIAYFHLLVHAYFKALMFMATGSVIHSSADYQDLRALSVPFKQSPWTGSILIVSNFSLMGLPFLGGFYSKDLFLEAGMSSTMGLGAAMLFVLGTGLTVLYSLRFLVLSGGSELLQGPLLLAKDSDFMMFKSYDMLFFLAIMGGATLNYAYLIFPPTLLLSSEMKNATLMLISIAWGMTLFSFNIQSTRLKQTLGLMLGLAVLSPGVLKSNVFIMAAYSEKLVEKALISNIIFSQFGNLMTYSYIFSLRNMAAFWIGGSLFMMGFLFV